MILLYSDGLSEQIQNIFELEHFNVDECIEFAKTNPPFLIPKNIEPENYKDFLEFSSIYISELQSRYMNDKLPIKTLLHQIPIMGLFRRNSISETLGCTDTLYRISNINISLEYLKEWKQYSHGGSSWDDITVISLFNYFLINYIPKRVDKQLKFININSINLLSLYQIEGRILFNKLSHDDLSLIIKFLIKELDLLDRLLDNCVGIGVNLISKNILDYLFGETKKDELTPGHRVAFIKCDNKMFFYDNNGVMDNEDEDKIYEDEPIGLRKSGHTLLVEFDWKNYLKIKIALLKPLLELSLIFNPIKIELLKIAILGFSEFMHIIKPDENMPYGREYLRENCIHSFQVITVENLSTEARYNELTHEINNVYSLAYTNTKNKPKVKAFVDEVDSLYDD